MHNLSTINVR